MCVSLDYNHCVTPPVGAPKFVGIGYYSSTGSIVLHVNIADKVYSSVAEVCKRRKERGEAFLEVGEQSDDTLPFKGQHFVRVFPMVDDVPFSGPHKKQN